MLQLLFFLFLAGPASAAGLETGAVIKSDGGAFFRNTIPQVARMGDGRLLAVFGSVAKTGGNGRVYGAFSSDGARTWSQPRLLIDDPQMDDGDPNILVDGNTVWVYATRTRIPNDIRKAWTTMVKSADNGNSWSQPKEIFIPRQYTPGKQHNGIRLRDGTYAMGISWDLWAEKGMAARTEGEMNLASGLLLSTDGEHWTLHGNLYAQSDDKVRPGFTNGLCEPSLVQLSDGEILVFLRSGGPHHYEARSRDGGHTWTSPVPGSLTGSNTPTALWRNEKKPDEIVAVWNSNPLNRWPLVAALSSNGGRSWTAPRILANPGRQVSYPGLTQLPDGVLVAVWQESLENGGRDIRYGRFTREWLLGITD
ncbi:MAG: exo-alpha-sialidase [Bryobacterales bacterium]|nr:exo-alpha-sialidase [Bryobacterales bacterium]